MISKYPYASSFLLSAISGLVNIYGIEHLGLVLTNVTGHFSGAILATGPVLLQTLGYIFCYGLGAFWAFGCTFWAIGTRKHWLKALPPFTNFLIFLAFNILPLFPVYFLLVAMSAQNGMGIGWSNGQIRPSQITGVVINFGEDLARLVFGKQALTQNFYTKIFNMFGFVAGGLLALYWGSKEVLWIPVGFYLILTGLVIFRKV